MKGAFATITEPKAVPKEWQDEALAAETAACLVLTSERTCASTEVKENTL